jgi:hypothetical protein
VSKVPESNKSEKTSEQLHVNEEDILDGVQTLTLHATSSAVEPSAQSTIPGAEPISQLPVNDSFSTSKVETQTLGSNQTLPSQIVRPKLPKLV